MCLDRVLLSVCTDLLCNAGHLNHVELCVLTGLLEHDEGRGHASQTPERLHVLAHVTIAVCTHHREREAAAVHCGTVVSSACIIIKVRSHQMRMKRINRAIRA